RMRFGRSKVSTSQTLLVPPAPSIRGDQRINRYLLVREVPTVLQVLTVAMALITLTTLSVQVHGKVFPIENSMSAWRSVSTHSVRVSIQCRGNPLPVSRVIFG